MIVCGNLLYGRICFWSWAIIYQTAKPSRIGGINTVKKNKKELLIVVCYKIL